MQEKRSQFPRFYFIGDDDLLEILGQATNPEVIQTHLKKLFAGIHSVQFDENTSHIVAMKSVDGEVVPLKHKVQIQPEVEVRPNPDTCNTLTVLSSFRLSIFPSFQGVVESSC